MLLSVALMLQNTAKKKNIFDMRVYPAHVYSIADKVINLTCRKDLFIFPLHTHAHTHTHRGINCSPLFLSLVEINN